jgi:hypothetical protein
MPTYICDSDEFQKNPIIKNITTPMMSPFKSHDIIQNTSHIM